MPIIAYKGFDKDLCCRGFRYEIGGEYSEEKAVSCECGFHACEDPLDCLSYYAPADSRYCRVELSGDIHHDSEDSKLAATHIKIIEEIDIRLMTELAAQSRIEAANEKNTNTGDWSAATNTGYMSAATNTGYKSAATNTGDMSAATNTGYKSAATNTGYMSAATNTGDMSAATNTGDWSAATNTGYMSAATNTGYKSAATNLVSQRNPKV